MRPGSDGAKGYGTAAAVELARGSSRAVAFGRSGRVDSGLPEPMGRGRIVRRGPRVDGVTRAFRPGLAAFGRLRRVMPWRFHLELGADALLAGAGVIVATLSRYDFGPPRHWLGPTLLVALAALVAQASVGSLIGLYSGKWRYGSLDEVAGLVLAVVATAVAISMVNLVAGRPVPGTAPVVASALALVAMAGIRYWWRLVLDRRRRPGQDMARPVVVCGAGEGGIQVVTAMLRNPDSPWRPVALLDDDLAKRRLRIMGVPVAGTTNDLASVAARFGAEVVIVAVPSAAAPLIRAVSTMAVEAHLEVRVLPPVAELFSSHIGVSDLRSVTEADLLGRRVIETDLDAISGYLTDQRVLVTGAGGSIGSELCRQLARFGAAELVMVDRDESALHAVQLTLEGRALLDSPNLVVCDIRDEDRVREVFATHRPQVVFHAAALKHLTLLERHPSEAIKTNVLATKTVLEAALEAEVERFVNISTDKAADPSSVLGLTKRVAERLTAEVARRSRGTFLSVRFGNVLGSRGSALQTFRAQIDAGGPVTVTDPAATRYFMTVEEAVQLVIQAGAVGARGEVLVLDMGEPVRIGEVARLLIEQSGRHVDIVYTGLRPGEKVHETVFATGEEPTRPSHPLISHVAVAPLGHQEVAKLEEAVHRRVDLMPVLHGVCDGGTPAPEVFVASED